MQPLAWLHPYKRPTETGTTFCTTMGASGDLVSEDLRCLWCAAYFLTGVKCPNMRTLRTSTRFILPFTVSSVTRSIGPPSICSHRIMDWARVPAHPSPRVPLSGITDPDPDFSLKPGGIRLRGFPFLFGSLHSCFGEKLLRFLD